MIRLVEGQFLSILGAPTTTLINSSYFFVWIPRQSFGPVLSLSSRVLCFLVYIFRSFRVREAVPLGCTVGTDFCSSFYVTNFFGCVIKRCAGCFVTR